MSVVSTDTSATFVLRIVASADSRRLGEELPIVGPMTIGRDAACSIVLEDDSVSRRHARVERVPTGLRIVDLKSGNGLWVGVRRFTELDLRPGERVQIGSTTFQCDVAGTDARARADAPARSDASASDAARASDAAAGHAPSASSDASTDVMPTMMLPSSPTIRVPIPVQTRLAPRGFVVVVIEGGDIVQAGTELAVEADAATVGRAVECTVRLTEPDVSRRHLRIERTDDGFALTDLGSTGGVWIDGRQIQHETIAAGQRFRVGARVVLACRPTVEVPDADSATIFLSPATIITGKPAAERARAAQAPDSSGAAAAPPAGAPAAPGVPAAPAGASGHAAPPAPPAAPAPPAEPSPAIAAALASSANPFEAEGERMAVSAHEPFLLDDPQWAYYVESGGILIFTVALEAGAPRGTRAHFLDVPAGHCLIGFDLQPSEVAAGFLAVPRQGTVVRRMKLARLRELAAQPAHGPVVATLIEGWVRGLSKSLARDLTTRRSGELELKAGTSITLPFDRKATASSEGIVWIEVWNGSVLFDDLAVPTFTRRHTLLPVAPEAWVQPVSEEFGALTLTPVRTADAIGNPLLWQGLAVFHEVLCECEFLNKKIAAADEYVRLRQKAQHAEVARDVAYDAIGSVLRPEPATPKQFLATGSTEPVLRACRLVGHALGLDVKSHPAASDDPTTSELTYEERVSTIALASGFRLRVVALRDDWYRQDHGPLLGQLEQRKSPVALLPTSARSYVLVDPMTGERQPVDEAVAATLTGFGYVFYRPFPDGAMTVWDVVRFGCRGLLPDLRLMLFTAMVVGLFGTVTPMLTGRIFDSAIPQADRSTLFGFGLALAASAAATAMFKLVQGVSSIRVQARMETAIQSALWDRLLTLPANFFRKYSAGDLSDRAAGVDQIQTLLSGAGISAVLGSVSGLFFVVQMLTYSVRLALVAVVLTFVYVGVNMLLNYIQLRYQRVEIQLRGRIVGLVLNLITGVTKLRICGAEPHAFRVWAQQFAMQRRLSFKIGTVQSVAVSFGSVFPIISAIAIFMVMMVEQEAAAELGLPGLTTGEFIAFNASYGLFLGAMQALGDASLNLLRIVPIYERLLPILTTQPETDSSKTFPGKLRGEIELSHVSFRYSEDGPWILRDVSLKIAPGDFVAFVGGSGSGKSTLMRLMLGFEQPTSGAIFYDGQDLNSLDLRMVRQQMGVVLQVSRVMPTEMYRNIIGVSSRTIDDAWRAAEMAGLADDIRAMPMGMHTYVSEGGGTLSGGQRQRLLIARAIVNRPKILFLDEATSALDNRAQAKVTESMDRMDATRVVIAHRLSTVVNANKICYLDSGRLAEVGSHAELMAKDGLFAALARRQMA